MWTASDVHKSIVWDDSKSTPHWELSLAGYAMSCDMTDADLRETIVELLALVNE